MKITSFVLSSAISGILIGSAFAQAPTTTKTTKTKTVADAPTEKQQNEVGVSSRDGITMSGDDVIITRNGLSEKLTKTMELPNGVRVEPNGTIMLNGEKLSLRPTQVLTFEGRFLNIPIKDSVAPTTTTTTTATQPATTAAEKAAAVEKATIIQREAEQAAIDEEKRRAAAKAGVPPRAGEGAQR